MVAKPWATGRRRGVVVVAVLSGVSLISCGAGGAGSSPLSGRARPNSVGPVTIATSQAGTVTVVAAALQLADLSGFWTTASKLSTQNQAQLAEYRTEPGCQPSTLS